MRFMVAWDGSEVSSLALRATIASLARADDLLLVYHVSNEGRYGDTEEWRVDALQKRLATELQGCQQKVLVQISSGGMQEFEIDCPASPLLTVHSKRLADEQKISQKIVDFACISKADILVMGSTGTKKDASRNFRKTTLGSSAHLAALAAPCPIVLIREGYKVDPKLTTVFMLAVDGSRHSMSALELCCEWARPDKDEIVCHVFGPPEFTESIEDGCTSRLQEVMGAKKVEYSVITTDLEDGAEIAGEELSEAAAQCRFRQQAFLVFGARGRSADNGREEDESPVAGRDDMSLPLTLGRVAKWCIRHAECSLIIARNVGSAPPISLHLKRASTV